MPIPTDIWSLGITIYAYVCAKLPFFSPDSELETDLMAKNKDPEYPSEMSADLTDLLNSMLAKEPFDRPSVNDILDHKWFKT